MKPRGRIGSRPLTQEEQRESPRITKALLKRVFGYLTPYCPYLLLVTLTIMVAAVLDMLPAILTGKIIDDGFIGRDFNLLLMLVGTSFAVLIISNLLGVAQSYMNTFVAQRITRDMRNQMYGHLQKMSHRFFTNTKQGDILTRMTSDIGGVQSVISGTLTSTLSNIAVLLTSLVAMYQKNWMLATVGVIIVPLFILPTKSVGKKRWELTAQAQEKQDNIYQVLNETLNVSGQQLVKLFTNEEREYEKYAQANEAMFRLKVKESMAGRWFRMTINTFVSLGPMLIYLMGGLLMLRMGYVDLTVGDITVMVALLTRMYRPVNSLLGIQVDFVRALALFSRIFGYLDMPVEISNMPGALAPADIRGSLAFEHVHFHYAADTPILKDISFEMDAGKTVAMVGPSGAGKSTIINLITRLYDVTEGRILLDGMDIRNLDLTTLRRSIGVVSQESYLFNGTIRDNLLYAKANASEAEMVSACRDANIADYISSLPQGYDTMVGNRGVKLSGGEKQRIALARVILKDPRLLILDEATSSLDSISETLIQEAFEPLLAQRTSLVIAHRLTTIMAADEILVIVDGEVHERGTHHNLLQRDGMYKELYRTQFKQVLNPPLSFCQGSGQACS